MRANRKQRQAQALPGAVINDDQDGNPGGADRKLRPAFLKTETLLPPFCVFPFALLKGGAALIPQYPPTLIPGLLLFAFLAPFLLAEDPIWFFWGTTRTFLVPHSLPHRSESSNNKTSLARHGLCGRLGSRCLSLPRSQTKACAAALWQMENVFV